MRGPPLTVWCVCVDLSLTAWCVCVWTPVNGVVCVCCRGLQKLYIVCDVALFVIANKSTACHLESPKDPVIPSKFYLIQDKVRPPTTPPHPGQPPPSPLMFCYPGSRDYLTLSVLMIPLFWIRLIPNRVQSVGKNPKSQSDHIDQIT